MSHRRWRENVAPGVSPGFRALKFAAPEGATEILPPLRGLLSFESLYPGLTPGATFCHPLCGLSITVL
jgi:hypothetical protein